MSLCLRQTCATTALLTALGMPLYGQALTVEAESTVTFRGMCDASGAVPLSDSLFMVADDEDNILRVYNADTGGEPVQTFNLATKLQQKLQAVDKPSSAGDLDDELDLEAATKVDGVSYWLTSHARNKKGKQKTERFQLIALSHDAKLDKVEVIGQPFGDLLQAMTEHDGFAPYKLGEASARAAESAGAVNIEGMTARFDTGVYIGFRNPVPRGKALLVGLDNPEGVARGEAAKLTAPAELDLAGLGIRGLSSWQGVYIIAAGDVDSGRQSALYSWAGVNASAQKMQVDLPQDFNPEAFFTPENRKGFLVLSDDGALEMQGKKECKKLKNPAEKSFRGLWLKSVNNVQVKQEQ